MLRARGEGKKTSFLYNSNYISFYTLARPSLEGLVFCIQNLNLSVSLLLLSSHFKPSNLALFLWLPRFICSVYRCVPDRTSLYRHFLSLSLFLYTSRYSRKLSRWAASERSKLINDKLGKNWRLNKSVPLWNILNIWEFMTFTLEPSRRVIEASCFHPRSQGIIFFSLF